MILFLVFGNMISFHDSVFYTNGDCFGSANRVMEPKTRRIRTRDSRYQYIVQEHMQQVAQNPLGTTTLLSGVKS